MYNYYDFKRFSIIKRIPYGSNLKTFINFKTQKTCEIQATLNFEDALTGQGFKA